MPQFFRSLEGWLQDLSKKKLLSLFIFLALVVYGNSLLNGFVWDDEAQILKNNFIHSLGNVFLFFQGGTFADGSTAHPQGIYYKPLLSLTFALLYSLVGATPFFFHLFQVVLHAVNTFLVFLFFTHFFKKKLSFILSLVFLTHPINVEAVAYISALQEPLFFFFGMISLFVVLHFQKTQLWYTMLFLTLLLSVLSKETGFLFLFVILIYNLLFSRKYGKHYVLIAIGVIISYAFLLFVVASQSLTHLDIPPIMRASLLERLYTMPSIIFFYIKTFFFPKDLITYWDWVVRTPSFLTFFFPLTIDILFFTVFFICAWLLYKSKKATFPIYLFFLLWFFSGILLHAQLIPLDVTVADRWFYFPMVGLLGMMGVIFESYSLSRKSIKILSVVIVIVLVCFICRTIIRNADWKSDTTLYTHDIQTNPNEYGLETNLGTLLADEGKYKEALYYLTKAASNAPYYWINWYNLGYISERTGQYGKAAMYYKKAAEVGDNMNMAENYAIFYIKRHQYETAVEIAQESVHTYPHDPMLFLVIAKAEYVLGNQQAALEAAQRAYALNPSDLDYYVLNQIAHKFPLNFGFK